MPPAERCGSHSPAGVLRSVRMAAEDLRPLPFQQLRLSVEQVEHGGASDAGAAVVVCGLAGFARHLRPAERISQLPSRMRSECRLSTRGSLLVGQVHPQGLGPTGGPSTTRLYLSADTDRSPRVLSERHRVDPDCPFGSGYQRGTLGSHTKDMGRVRCLRRRRRTGIRPVGLDFSSF